MDLCVVEGFVWSKGKEKISVMDANGKIYWANLCQAHRTFEVRERVWVAFRGFGKNMEVLKILRHEYASSARDLLEKLKRFNL